MYVNQEDAFGGTSKLLSLVDHIYAAVSDRSLWPAVLEGITEAAGGSQIVLFARSSSDQMLSLARFDPVAWNLYADYYSSVNVMMDRCDVIFSDGDVRYSTRAMPDSDFEKTEFYNDYFKHHDMHYSFGLKIPLDGLPPAYISCQRPKSKGAFEEREGLVYLTLLPHLRRALTLYFQFSQMRANNLGLETALDAFQHAVFGINQFGQVVLANRQAVALTTEEDALALSNENLTSVFPDQALQLRQLLQNTASIGSEFGLPSGNAMLLRRRSGKSPLRLVVMPFRSTLPASSILLSTLVFVSDPSSQTMSRARALQALYSLSPIEARIAEHLSNGIEVRNIAQQIGATLETTRFYVKRILAKTGTHRQAELVRLTSSLPSIHP